MAVPEKYRTGWRLLGGDDASLMPHRQPAGQSLQDLHSRPGITGTFPLWQQLQGMQLATSEEDAAMEAVAAGASGYLQKYSGKDRLLNTVRDVAQGEYRLPADVIRRAFAGIRGTAQLKADTEVRRLTARGKGDTHALCPGAVLRADS